jgi:hypothetical protein
VACKLIEFTNLQKEEEREMLDWGSNPRLPGSTLPSGKVEATSTPTVSAVPFVCNSDHLDAFQTPNLKWRQGLHFGVGAAEVTFMYSVPGAITGQPVLIPVALVSMLCLG